MDEDLPPDTAPRTGNWFTAPRAGRYSFVKVFRLDPRRRPGDLVFGEIPQATPGPGSR